MNPSLRYLKEVIPEQTMVALLKPTLTLDKVDPDSSQLFCQTISSTYPVVGKGYYRSGGWAMAILALLTKDKGS